MKRVLCVALVVLSLACEKERDDVTKTDGGVCVLGDAGQDKLCIDFPQSIAANDASGICDAERTNGGFSGISYTSGHANTCANTSSQDDVGHCELTSGIIYRFGDIDYDVTSGAAACSALSGTWTAE